MYQHLREAIVSLELAPGQAVIIEQLAAMLGVSRTPIREALLALLHAGLLEETRDGFRVAPLDATYVWEVYAVRSALESLAIEAVVPQLTDDDLRELRGRAFPRAPRPDGDYSETIGPDLSFHNFIRSKCTLPYLCALIDSVEVHRRRLLHLERSAPLEYRRLSYQEHLAIFQAFERRDVGAARRLMQEHFERIRTEITALTRQQQAEAGGSS